MIAAFDRVAGDQLRQRPSGFRRTPRQAEIPNQCGFRGDAAAVNQDIDVGGGEIQAGEPLYGRPYQDISGPKSVLSLLEEKTQQAISQDNGRIEIEGIGRTLSSIGNNDTFGSSVSGNSNRNIRRQPPISE